MSQQAYPYRLHIFNIVKHIVPDSYQSPVVTGRQSSLLLNNDASCSLEQSNALLAWSTLYTFNYNKMHNAQCTIHIAQTTGNNALYMHCIAACKMFLLTVVLLKYVV